MISEQLMQRIKTKDREAFKELFDTYREKVYRMSYIILKDKTASEDVLQEVFIQVYLKIRDLKHTGAFEVWLYRITMNCCRKFIKKENKINTINVNENYDTYTDIQDNEINTPENIIVNQELCKEVMNVLYELPEHQRISLTLFYYNELSIKEIANVMKCAEGTVKSRLFHGKKYLKDRVAKII
ncbi:RNA polymerase sigma factor [Clostridium sp.]|uniref:RNA polymerase sigma factor n=1 Tax=Clostridium sp. TaxID=1506 RepID=UPI003D6CE6F2